jgi:flagellin
MIINDNLPALNAFNALTANTTAMNKALNELTTGKAVNSAADDPSGYTISEGMQAQINGLNTANDNSQNAVSMLQTASGGIEQIQSVVQRMRELALEANNGTESAADITALQAEFGQLSAEVTQIAGSTQFNGMNLLTGKFSGAANAVKLQVGANAGQTFNYQIGAQSLKAIGLSGIVVSGAGKASGAIIACDNAIANISAQDSVLGASINRLDYIQSNVTSQAQNQTAANATIVDVDMASEMTAYTQASVLTQSATSMLAQAQQEPTSVLKLLGS